MRSFNSRRPLRAAGFTLVETCIASACTLLLLGVALPAFTSVDEAGDQGATRTRVESETRFALMKMARELENTSTTAVDTAGNPRLSIVDGGDPDPMVQDVDDMGGFEGTLGGQDNDDNNNVIDASTDVIGGTAAVNGATNTHENTAMGSGARGGSMWGRSRSADAVGTVAIGASVARPRHAVILKNSILTFQKVLSYTIDVTGAPVVTWTTPVEYRVINRKLIRTQDGNQSTVCNVCVGFQAVISDAGTVIVTIVSQAKTHGKGRIVADANQIEVGPKN